MTTFRIDGHAIEVRHQHEVLRIEPWGPDSVRVRAGYDTLPTLDVGALGEPPVAPEPTVTVTQRHGTLVQGALTVDVDHEQPESGGFTYPLVRFTRTDSGEELLAEEPEHFWWPSARVRYGNRAGSGQVHQQFRAYPGERLFGMGQRTHGRLDHKGLSLDLVHRNAEVSIPFVLSNRGYGLLWNNPAIGHVEFADNYTRWTAEQSQGLDYWITAGSPAQVLARYADATGHAPAMPRWATGLWQSKLRYLDQEELLGVVREYQRREVPLSVIVTDFFHWTAMGDYKLDPAEYPDPQAMMTELDEAGVKLMVSIWPTVSPLSENFEHLRDEGMLVGSDQGVEFHGGIQDKGMTTRMPVAFYDPTNPSTREFIWSVAKKNYYDLGVRVWWLDACEPEINPGHHANLTYHAGPGAQVAGIYPRENARAFAEGMARAAAESGRPEDGETVLLCRSAWAGHQKYPAAVWSGDIRPTWQSLNEQVRAGLSIAVAGIPWWTTDIGGFHGGDPSDPDYRELVVRWFQYGAFCPLFRLHGYREPRPQLTDLASGGPNEIWSYGEEAFGLIKDVILMRERLRPYLHAQLDRASEEGLPPMRPLFVDFADDEAAWTVDDEFLFGSDVLVAPVLHFGARTRSVYLPAGASWTDAWTGEVHAGSTTIEADAPLDRIPVFLKDGAAVPVAG